MFKKILNLILLYFIGFSTLQATHLSGGDIQYRYIGDSTGTAHHYEVYLRLYRDASGVSMGNTATVTISSSCFNNINVTCSLQVGTGPGNVAPSLFDCVSSGAPGTKSLEIWGYKGIVILPGKCADYKFAWSSCCRPPGITNIPGSTSKGFYFEATLNNFAGNNSSPLFTSEPVRAFCVGRNFNWKHSALELDGDSVYFSLIANRELNSNSIPSNIVYNTGYTPQHPITTPAGYPGVFTLNNATGNINFTPTQSEIDILAVLIEEYRFDTILNSYVKIGSSNRDMMVTISPSCSPAAQLGVTLNYSDPNTYFDSISRLPTINAFCADTSFALHFKSKLDCISISPDGSDFFLLSSATMQPIPILNAVAKCDQDGNTRDIYLNLYNPLTASGDYYLTTKIGLDGNSILTKCGYAINPKDTIVLRVSCSAVGIEENSKPRFNIYPNPATKTLTIKNIDVKIKPLSLVIYSNSGQQVFKNNFPYGDKYFEINIENFDDGFYIIELTTDAGVFYHRFIKM